MYEFEGLLNPADARCDVHMTARPRAPSKCRRVDAAETRCKPFSGDEGANVCSVPPTRAELAASGSAGSRIDQRILNIGHRPFSGPWRSPARSQKVLICRDFLFSCRSCSLLG